MAPLVSHVLELGLIEAIARAAARRLRRRHPVRARRGHHSGAGGQSRRGRRHPRSAAAPGKKAAQRTILFNLCGHGHFDMQSYIDYQAGKLENYEYPAEEIAMALAGLPAVK